MKLQVIISDKLTEKKLTKAKDSFQAASAMKVSWSAFMNKVINEWLDNQHNKDK